MNSNEKIREGQEIQEVPKVHEGDAAKETLPAAITPTMLDETVARISKVYANLETGTAIIVYSGNSDIRRLNKLAELHEQKQRYQKEYKLPGVAAPIPNPTVFLTGVVTVSCCLQVPQVFLL